ncbi:DUF427-domain-containing protein [Pseudohyphozyma bogoriensis]|nr:DUF427-domain-containing protein [Pseudohyphozyma bogoriensis]
MPLALYKQTILASTDAWVENSTPLVEGNYYFPPEAVKMEYLRASSKATVTHCPWKGEAHYYDLHVGDDVIKDGAWYYPEPLEKAKHLRAYVAFDKTKVQGIE